MKKGFFSSILILILLLSSCGSTQKISVGEIEKIYFNYNQSAPLNFGGTITGRFMVRLLSGKEIDVTDNRKFTFVSLDIAKTEVIDQYEIIKRPSHFNEHSATMTLSYEDKGEVYRTEELIQLNLKGDLLVNIGGKDGTDGQDMRDRGNKLIGKNGKDGDSGTNGENGNSSGSYEAFVWEANDTAFISVRDLNSGFYYK